MGTTYRPLASHQFKPHPPPIQALTHTERRMPRIEMNSHWSVRSFRSDYLWSSFKTSLLLLLSIRFTKLFNPVHPPVPTRICINFDQINTISFDQIEYQIITKSFDLIEYSKCQKNNLRKDRFLKHPRDNPRDHSHPRDNLHLLDHDQLLSKNVHHSSKNAHHHLLPNQMSAIKNFSESYEMNQARSWSMST
jgi:hypothetical protein